MSSFGELLKQTVSRVDESYRLAAKELSAEVAAAATSVQEVTNQLATLVLVKRNDEVRGEAYVLALSAQDKLHTIALMDFSPTGYPITVSASIPDFRTETYSAILRSRDEVRKFFEDMASNPNSRLVLTITHLLRKSPIGAS